MRQFVIAFILFVASIVSPLAYGHAGERVAARPSGGRGGNVGTFPNEVIDVAGAKREYRLVVPRGIDPEKPAPLVFAFHGFLIDSKDLMPVYSQLDRLAAEKKFVLAYPNGRNRAWPLVLDWARDDLAFFDALYERLTGRYNIDRNRVYLAGMSNGAYFAHLLASQRADRIAAIACHSGGLGFLALADLNVEHKYAVIVIHGADDSIVHVSEGRKTRDAYTKWGHPVRYVEVPRWNHLWALKADVNAKIWEFFDRHPLDHRRR